MTTTTIVTQRRRAYLAAFEARYRMYIAEVFFPEVDGARQPLFTNVIDERQQFLRLREVARRLEAVNAGMMQPDYETQAFAENRDGAQQRYIELEQKFRDALP